MKRNWIALFAALALVVVSCGESDGDEAATDAVGAEESAEDESGSDDDPGDDGSDGDDSADNGSGDGESEGGAGGDPTAPTDGLRLAIYESILAASTVGGQDPLSEEETAACIANGSVDAIGEDGLAAYGITEDNVGSVDDVDFDEDDADALAEVWVGCIDFAGFVAESGGTAEQQACLLDVFQGPDFVDSVSLAFQGPDGITSVFTQAGFSCFSIDAGGDDAGGDDGGAPAGGIDDAFLESLIDSLGLDESQVACIQEQQAGGLNVRDPNDMVTIMDACNLG